MSKLIDKRNGQTVVDAFKCEECGERYFDRLPSISCGDESLNYCGECRTVEGGWTELFINESDEEVPEEFVILEGEKNVVS